MPEQPLPLPIPQAGLHPHHQAAQEAFGRLLQLMDDLRTHCPWDQKQTLESLRHLTIEETYELSDAILANDLSELEGELGDLLLHIVFYAKIGAEQNAFTVESLLHRLCDKLVHRHPHIYSDTVATDAATVATNWEKIKVAEGSTRKSVLEGVPNSMPALVKAYRMQQKVAGYGFDWAEMTDVLAKVREELAEFEEELNAPTPAHARMEAEFGDLLFSLINFARHAGINAEDALERTNRKFRQRFQAIEAEADLQGRALTDLSLEEMEAAWQAAKRNL